MTEQEYLNKKEILQGEIADCKKAYARAALAADDGIGDAEAAEKCRGAVTKAEGRLETLEVAYEQSKTEAVQRALKERLDVVQDHREKIERLLTAKAKAARDMQDAIEVVGRQAALMEELSTKARKAADYISPELRHEADNIRSALVGSHVQYRTLIAGHLAKAGLSLDGISFTNAKFAVAKDSVSDLTESYISKIRNRLRILDKGA